MTQQSKLQGKLYESTLELCEAMMNWITSNRRAFSKVELEDYRKRVMVIPKGVTSALEKNKIDECFEELIIVNKEVNAVLMEIKSRYRTIGRLEGDIEDCFTKFRNFLNYYHYC